MTRYLAVAKRWDKGWELHIEGVGVTQVERLSGARRQVADYVETLLMDSTSELVPAESVEIVVDLDGLETRIAGARELGAHAAQATRDAAAELRSVVRELRARKVPVADIAELIGVSHGRVSQLVRTPES